MGMGGKALEVPIRLVDLRLLAHATPLQLTPANHQASLKLVGLFVEVLPLFLPATLLLGLPLLLVALHVGTLSLSPVLLAPILQRLELGVQSLATSLLATP